ncbi:hypothetical protein CFIO01_04077 [Colletotrichum fioriniae PJ7]|uniref:Uncharacterized protein n=1 Tax=Colletotrichum fioriniae PJ7 TaxID=1445577 RepID=A0A010QBM1_9PEZI|nr:hypothetical protein CFIO01_04077 [Colletotrichum fioriniae PJ7]
MALALLGLGNFGAALELVINGNVECFAEVMQLVHVIQSPKVSPGPVPGSAPDFPNSRHPAVPGSGSIWERPACPPAPPIRQFGTADAHGIRAIGGSLFLHGKPAYLVKIYFC